MLINAEREEIQIEGEITKLEKQIKELKLQPSTKMMQEQCKKIREEIKKHEDEILLFKQSGSYLGDEALQKQKRMLHKLEIMVEILLKRRASCLDMIDFFS